MKKRLLLLLILLLAGPAAAQKGVVLHATVSYDFGDVTIQDTAIKAGYPPVAPSKPGPYTLRLVDAEGDTVRARTFDIQRDITVQDSNNTVLNQTTKDLIINYSRYATAAVLYANGDEVDRVQLAQNVSIDPVQQPENAAVNVTETRADLDDPLIPPELLWFTVLLAGAAAILYLKRWRGPSKEEYVAQVQEMLERGDDPSTIGTYLEEEGFSPEEIDDIIERARTGR